MGLWEHTQIANSRRPSSGSLMAVPASGPPLAAALRPRTDGLASGLWVAYEWQPFIGGQSVAHCWLYFYVFRSSPYCLKQLWQISSPLNAYAWWPHRWITGLTSGLWVFHAWQIFISSQKPDSGLPVAIFLALESTFHMERFSSYSLIILNTL